MAPKPPAPDSEGSSSRLVLGLQPVREAIRVHKSALIRVLLEAGNGKHEGLARLCADENVPFERVARSKLDSLARGTSHQGAAAFAPPLRLGPSQELLSDPSLLGLVLDGIQDPQNFGAVIRSSVGVADAWLVWGENNSAPLSPATFRAAAGAAEHARLCRVPSLRSLLQQARDEQIQIVGLDAQAPEPLAKIDLTERTLIVIGSEGTGMAKATRRTCTAIAHLVHTHRIDSLNASVAAGIALYESVKQRTNSSS